MRPWRITSFFFPALLIGAALSFSSELSAQTTASGALAGVVIDQTGAAVSDAEVTIRNNAKATTQSTKTNREGVYRFSFLAPASYTLTVKHVGFREEQRSVNVLLGTSVSVNVTLALARASTEITVAGEVPLRYAHPTEEHQAEAIRRLERFTLGKMAETVPAGVQ